MQTAEKSMTVKKVFKVKFTIDLKLFFDIADIIIVDDLQGCINLKTIPSFYPYLSFNIYELISDTLFNCDLFYECTFMIEHHERFYMQFELTISSAVTWRIAIPRTRGGNHIVGTEEFICGEKTNSPLNTHQNLYRE